MTSFSQLYKLEKALVEGAIPNAVIGLQETNLKVGDKVNAKYKGGGKWFAGKIKQIRADGSYDIEYDDGEVEYAVVADLVCAVARRIEEGSKVEANFRGKGKFFPGRVKRDRGDGTYDIDYNDGEQEIRVPADMIRRLYEPGSGGSGGKATTPEVGDKVEANYKGRGKWYSGKIKRVRLDGSYDIDYDDGEFELHVAADLVRVVGGSNKDDSSSRAALIEEGPKEEANCNALFYALGLHRSPEQRSIENIAAVACLLSRNAALPSTLAKVYKRILGFIFYKKEILNMLLM